MTPSFRRYDIDWLRVITIGLLLIYHIGIAFQPWGVFIGFIQSENSLEWLWTPMSMLNVWRIPLLFFISGMGVSFAIKKRNLKQLIKERSLRILLPFVFGFFFIVPIHLLIWQYYYNQDLTYAPGESHLWFLGFIFAYVLLLGPLFFYLKKKKSGKLGTMLKGFIGSPVGLLLIVGVFMLEAVIVNPETFELYSMTWHGFILGLLAFFFGFLIIYSGEKFWTLFAKYKWMFLSIAVVLYLVRLFMFELKASNALMSVESSVWIFAIFGIAKSYLNHESKLLRYLSEGAYPIYIIHMVFLYLGSYFIMPLAIGAWIKFILLITFTFLGCFISYEFIIKRSNLLRPMFGLKSLDTNAIETKYNFKIP